MTKIFIVGSGRSGTTLLQSIICSDPAIFTFRETHFMRKAKRPIYFRAMDHLFLNRKRLRNAMAFVRDNNPVKGTYDLTHVGTNKALVRFLDQFLSNEAALNEKSGWVEKTPEHINYVRYFLKHIPDVRIIHAIRDGRDVVASLYDACKKYPQAWKGFETIEKAVYYYNRSIIKSLRFAGIPGNFFLNYDSLVDDPDGAISAISDFVGITLRPDLGNVDSSSSKIIRSEEGWKKENTGEGIQNVKFKKFKKMFTPGEQEYITANIISMEEIRDIVNPSGHRAFHV